MPFPFYEQQRRFALGRIPEPGAYGVPTSVSSFSNWVELVVRDKNLAKAAPKVIDNEGQSTGVDWATDQWIISHDMSRDIEIHCSTAQLGRLLYGGLGGITTTALSGPDTGAYQHDFVPQDPNGSGGRQLPAFSFVEQVSTGIDRLFPGCVVEKMSISGGSSGDNMDKIVITVSLRGSGRYITPSALTIGNTTGLVYLFNSQAQFLERDYNTLANPIAYGIAARGYSWKLDIDNGLLGDEGYRPGAGQYQSILGSAATVSAATNAAPVIITTSSAHGFSTGNTVTVSGVLGNLGANVTSTITVLTSTTFSLDNSTGTGVYTSGGTATVYDPTSGAVRSEMLFGTRKYSFEAKIRYKGESEELQKLRSQTSLDLQITTTGALIPATTKNHSLVFAIALGKYLSADISESNGLFTVDIKSKALFDVVSGKIFRTFRLLNDVASYTV